jgi:signal transduction histidine kinase
MIIHDLRNPLSSIVSSLELVRATVVDGKPEIPLDQIFAVAKRSSQKLYLLIDSLLDLARLEEGWTELAYTQVDVPAMVGEVVEQVRPIATAHELHLESHLAPDVPSLYADRDLLQRVLLNLLDNAVKFTPPGGKVELRATRSGPDTVLFAVSDTGRGISPEHHERVFERFTRVSGRQARGTGLGLALCKLGVEAHGGRIWVESEPGQGATFKFVLPVEGPQAVEGDGV